MQGIASVVRGPRANRVADGEGPRQVGPGTTWLDKAAFTQPTAGTFGSSGSGVVRGPGLKNADVSVQKSLRFRESRRLEFRAEFFNFTNTPEFNAPVLAVQSPTFGELTGAQGEREIQVGLKFYF